MTQFKVTNLFKTHPAQIFVAVLSGALGLGTACFLWWPGAFRWFAVTAILAFTVWESGRCFRRLSADDREDPDPQGSRSRQ
jgi:hypothetical protein